MGYVTNELWRNRIAGTVTIPVVNTSFYQRQAAEDCARLLSSMTGETVKVQAHQGNFVILRDAGGGKWVVA